MDSILKEILFLLFGIDESATINDLKKAYRKRATEFHSDKNSNIDPNIFIALTKGYELLQTEISGDSKKPKTSEEEFKPHQTGSDIPDSMLKKYAAEKLTNCFNECFTHHLNNKFVTRKDIFLEIENLFGQETADIRKVNRELQKEIELLNEAKQRIKSNNDSVALLSSVDDLISHRRFSMRQNKNKIKINNYVNSFLEEYSFVHPNEIK